MVKCQLCGREFKALTHTHLRKAHGMTIAEYQAKFPGAPLREVSEEQRENYSKAAVKKWADPEYKAANAPRLAAMASDANAALQEKRKSDPECNKQFLEACQAAQAKNRKEPNRCACGASIERKAEQCQPCYQASRLEQAMHPCKYPECDVPVKGQKEYCSGECLKSDPAYVESKQQAGRISQEKRPDNVRFLKPHPEVLNRPDVRAKQRIASSAYHKGKPKSLEQRLKMSASQTRHWRKLGVTGEARKRPDNWNLICDIVRLRDKRCWICDKTRSLCGRALDVHHINGKWWDNRWVNLITLCLSHHMKVTGEGNIWRPWPLPEELPFEELEPLGLLGYHPDYLEPYAQLLVLVS